MRTPKRAILIDVVAAPPHRPRPVLDPHVGRVRCAPHEQAAQIRIAPAIGAQPLDDVAPHQAKAGEDETVRLVEQPPVEQPDRPAPEPPHRRPSSPESAAHQVVSLFGLLDQACDLAGRLLQVIIQA